MKFLFGAIFGRKEWVMSIYGVVDRENVCIFRQPIQQESNDYYRIKSEKVLLADDDNI